jgi:hypothetical protein
MDLLDKNPNIDMKFELSSANKRARRSDGVVGMARLYITIIFVVAIVYLPP